MGAAQEGRVGQRPSWREVLYVAVVAAVAAVAMLMKAPWLVGAAVLLTVPTGLAALVAYYGLYGLLALVPGANPSSSSGSGTVAPDGTEVSSSTGDQAVWFAVATPLLAVALLTGAAVVNVLALRVVARGRRSAVRAPRA